MNIQQFQQKILRWYAKNRRDMPWRNTYDPYKILISEIMLQQTQVSRVLPKYKEFLKAFPNTARLAKAPTSKLLNVWRGLGYWRRALFLREAARVVQKKYGGKFPRDPALLGELPGIGNYTTRAVACFAFGHPEAFVDTNIRRVYLHFFFPNQHNVSDKKILEVAQKAVWKKNPREWHYALFDYGAIALKDAAINKRSRHWHKQSKFHGSFRSFRTKALKFVLAKNNRKTTLGELEKFLKTELADAKSDFKSEQIIQALEKDGLITRISGNSYEI